MTEGNRAVQRTEHEQPSPVRSDARGDSRQAHPDPEHERRQQHSSAREWKGPERERRVISFGWRYDFNDHALHEAEEMPPFLLPLRDAAARFAGLPAETLQHVLVTEYSAGAGIGWHRDKGVFGDVIGISLLSPCVLRMRRQSGERWERRSLRVEPRSVYLFRGEARTDWEHSIPEVDALRYSIIFRNLRQSAGASAASAH